MRVRYRTTTNQTRTRRQAMSKTQISDRVDRLTAMGFTPGEAIAIAVAEAHRADNGHEHIPAAVPRG
jgi:uncharacterized protein YoaH (UPF0181 family)